MGISQIMAGWTATDKLAKRDANEDERLLTLFWNRAELKKEFSNLRHDRDDLLQRLREQEKKTESVRRQLAGMEDFLADPDSGYRAIVYFQLRALWNLCNRKLARFCEQLQKQQQDRERKRQIMEFNQGRQKRQQELSTHIVSLKAEVDEMKSAVADVERRRDNLRGFWNYFKRREIQTEVEEKQAQLASVRAALEELFDRRIKVESEPWPDYSGLGLGGKRAINVAMIALAQHLFVLLSTSSVSALTRTARHKKLEDVSYGQRADCEYMMKKIDELTAALNSDSNYADELRARTEMLTKQAEYSNEKDTVPSAGCFEKLVTSVPGFDGGRGVSSVPIDVNVLADDYWDIQSLLMK